MVNETHTINSLLRPWVFISSTFCWRGGGLIEEGLFETRVSLFNLAKMIVSSPHKVLECKVQKFRHIKLEVMQPKISKNKSELPAHD